MKKLYVLFLLFFALPALASGIASNSATAPCTNTTLETYSGNTNLAADWQPNTINLRWYNNNTLLDVQSAANTCVYDGTLTVPSTAPNRTGYTFAGWEVRPQMDFGTIPTNTNGLNRWAIGWYENADYCWYDTNTGTATHVDCDSDDNYKELQTHEWKVRFEHGYLYGMLGCGTQGGTWSQVGYPAITNEPGQYCWCKATAYKANNAEFASKPSAELSWVFASDRGSVENCVKSCAANCANNPLRTEKFRVALFTPAAN